MDLANSKLVEIYNNVGDKITTLYQWDINQILYLRINADITLTDNNYISINHKTKYQIQAKLAIDEVIINVPNALLQSDKTLYIEVYGYTAQIPIKKEPKPYVYEYMNEIQGQPKKKMIQATISETEEYFKINSTIIGA